MQSKIQSIKKFAIANLDAIGRFYEPLDDIFNNSDLSKSVIENPEIVHVLESALENLFYNDLRQNESIDIILEMVRRKFKYDKLIEILVNIEKQSKDNSDLSLRGTGLNLLIEKSVNIVEKVIFEMDKSISLLTTCSIYEANKKLSSKLFLEEIIKEKEAAILSIGKNEEESFNRIKIKERSLDKKVEEVSERIRSEEDRLSGTFSELTDSINHTFSIQQSNNLEAVSKQTRASINEIQKTSQDAAVQFHGKVDSRISEINDRINQEVSVFESRKKEIEKILGDISNAHQSNANRIQADKENKTANYLRIIGTSGLLAVILFSLFLFDSYLGFFGRETMPDDDLSPQWFLVRFFTITLITGPFIYLLKESANHRNRENLYRQRGTQLSSIGAYLSELPLEEKAKLKKELAANFFTYHEGKTDTSNVPDFIKNFGEAVKVVNSMKQSNSANNSKPSKQS